MSTMHRYVDIFCPEPPTPSLDTPGSRSPSPSPRRRPPPRVSLIHGRHLPQRTRPARWFRTETDRDSPSRSSAISVNQLHDRDEILDARGGLLDVDGQRSDRTVCGYPTERGYECALIDHGRQRVESLERDGGVDQCFGGAGICTVRVEPGGNRLFAIGPLRSEVESRACCEIVRR